MAPTLVTAAPTRNTIITCDTFPETPGVQTIFESNEEPYFLDRTDGGTPLVLGMRFETTVEAEIHSFRFFKATSEDGTAHKARIYNWVTGQLLSEIRFSDNFCPGPAWVDVPLSPSFTALPGIEYVVAIDSVTRYTLTRDYFTPGVPKMIGDLGVLGSVYGLESGAMPKELNRATSNYWIDRKFLDAPLVEAHEAQLDFCKPSRLKAHHRSYLKHESSEHDLLSRLLMSAFAWGVQSVSASAAAPRLPLQSARPPCRLPPSLRRTMPLAAAPSLTARSKRSTAPAITPPRSLAETSGNS